MLTDSWVHLRRHPLMKNTTLAADAVVPLTLGPGPEFLTFFWYFFCWAAAGSDFDFPGRLI